MVEFNVGVPGSGKTYKAVYVLYANFGLDKKLIDEKYIIPNIKFAFTNINELKLDKFENVNKLDWDLFKVRIFDLHNSSVKNKMTDSLLYEKAKEMGIANSLIVIDECHNYLDRNDKS
jgi:zona occludens toxin